MLSYDQVCTMDLLDVVKDMNHEFCIEIPTQIDSLEEMSSAGTMLGDLTNEYTYMVALLAMMKATVRIAKRKLPKEQYEDLVGKRDAVSDIVDLLKQQYQAISRMITVKQEINQELYMTSGKGTYPK